MTSLVKIAFVLCVAVISDKVSGNVISHHVNPKPNESALDATRQIWKLAEVSSTTANTTCPQFDDVVDRIGDIITNTVTIVTGIVDTAYSSIYSTDVCGTSLTGFRCFLKKFHTTYSTAETVISKIVDYSATVSNLDTTVKTYFENKCWQQ